MELTTEKSNHLTVYVDKKIFAKIYRLRCIDIVFKPDATVLNNNEFVRIKTSFNETWFADFKIAKILMKENIWTVWLGEKQGIYARGNKKVRWFQECYENSEDGRKSNGRKAGVKYKKL